MTGKSTDIELLEKENLVLYKRYKEGKTLQEIANELGYANASGVQKAEKRALARIEHPDREEYLKQHLAWYASLIDTFAAPAIQGNLKAFDAFITVLDKQTHLLGLNAPKKVEQEVNIYGHGSLNEEVIRIARVIEYIEGSASDITTLPELPSESEPHSVATPSEEGTITAGG